MIKYASNASKLHKSFGDMLIKSGLGGFSIQQEVAVKTLCPSYKNGRDRFDYYIPELNVVVELHGEQHYKPVKFGGVSDNKATQNYIKRVKVDEQKAIAARTAGFLYVSFSYEEEITMSSLSSKMEEERLTHAHMHVIVEEEEDEYLIQRREDINKKNRAYGKALREKNKERDRAYRKKLYQESKNRD